MGCNRYPGDTKLKSQGDIRGGKSLVSPGDCHEKGLTPGGREVLGKKKEVRSLISDSGAKEQKSREQQE